MKKHCLSKGWLTQNLFFCLDRVQFSMRKLFNVGVFKSLQRLSHRWDGTSLSFLYQYYGAYCTDKFKISSIPRAFAKDTLLVAFTQLNHRHSLEVPVKKKQLHDNSFFPRTVGKWIKFSTDCFPGMFNISFFKKTLNNYLEL